jgi:histidyl-tRNA synthetase
VFITLDKYDKIGEAGIEKELLDSGYDAAVVAKYMEIFRSTMAAEDRFSYLEGALGDAIEEGVIANVKTICDAVAVISDGRFNLDFDVTLVRGMGYYTGTIFEIKSEDFKGSSIGGGGRYDKMIGNFTGQNTPACGFSIGFERIVAALVEKDFKPEGAAEKTAILYDKRMSVNDFALMQKAAMEARAEGKIVLVQKMNKNVGFQKQKLEADGYSKFIDIRFPDEMVKLEEI